MNSKFLNLCMAVGVSGSLILGVTSCKDDEVVLPAIGGFNTAADVAATNLVAHWGFEGDGKETKSGAVPASSTNATYETGAKGKGVKFTKGFLAYNAITALNSLPNMSVTAWVNVDNNSGAPGVPTSFFTMSRPNEWAGNINLMSETGWRKAGRDTLIVKGLIVSNKAGSPNFQDVRNEPSNGGVQVVNGINKWTHIVMSYDATSEKFKVYANGVKVSNPDWETRATTGPLTFYSPTKPVIGAWGTNVAGGGTAEGWQVPMTGSMDEVRVFNKALTDAEINSLYLLEKAGR